MRTPKPGSAGWRQVTFDFPGMASFAGACHLQRMSLILQPTSRYTSEVSQRQKARKEGYSCHEVVGDSANSGVSAATFVRE